MQFCYGKSYWRGGYDLGEDGRAGNLSGEFNSGTYLATLDYKKHVGISIGADGRVTEEVWKCMIGLQNRSRHGNVPAFKWLKSIIEKVKIQ